MRGVMPPSNLKMAPKYALIYAWLLLCYKNKQSLRSLKRQFGWGADWKAGFFLVLQKLYTMSRQEAVKMDFWDRHCKATSHRQKPRFCFLNHPLKDYRWGQRVFFVCFLSKLQFFHTFLIVFFAYISHQGYGSVTSYFWKGISQLLEKKKSCLYLCLKQ